MPTGAARSSRLAYRRPSRAIKTATNCPAQRPCARRRPPLTPLALPFAIAPSHHRKSRSIMRLQPRCYPTRSAAVENPIGVSISHPARRPRTTKRKAPGPRLCRVPLLPPWRTQEAGGGMYMYIHCEACDRLCHSVPIVCTYQQVVTLLPILPAGSGPRCLGTAFTYLHADT